MRSGRTRRDEGWLRTWSAASPTPEHLAPAAGPCDPETRCLLALGGALLGYGLPAHRVEESVLRLARVFGRDMMVYALPTIVQVTVYRDGTGTTFGARAHPAAIDLARLDALHRLVAEVESGRTDRVGLEGALTDILGGAARRVRALDTLAVAAVAGGGGLMLGLPLAEAGWGVVLGLGVATLLGLAASKGVLERVMPLFAAAMAMLGGCALGHAHLVVHPFVTAACAMLVLLPGLSLTLAMVELATGHLVSGAARGIWAVAVLVQIGTGVLFGAELGGLDRATLAPLSAASLAPASVGALLLALGFARLMSVRVRDGLATLCVCALAFFVCRGVGACLGADLGALVAATAVGLVSHAFARGYDRPSSTLMLPGVTMLVPGSLGLIAVSAAALNDPALAVGVGVQMGMVIVALSSGVLLATALLPPRTAW